MAKIEFDKDHWTQQLLQEIGLSEVPLEDLDKYFIDSGYVFSTSELKKTAKEYVEEQLAILEQQYNDFNSSQEEELVQPLMLKEFDVNTTLLQLQNVSSDLDNIPSDESFREKDVVDVPNFKYFEVNVEDKNYVVVINDINDSRISDQIKHVKNTSYYIEDRTANSITNDDIILSYYQFANLIERIVAKKNNQVDIKIREELKTSFEGFQTKVFDE